jgi:bacteriocin-like protein
MSEDQKQTKTSEDEKPSEELSEDQLEAVSGGLTLSGAVPVVDALAAKVNDSSLLQSCATGEHFPKVIITR